MNTKGQEGGDKGKGKKKQRREQNEDHSFNNFMLDSCSTMND